MDIKIYSDYSDKKSILEKIFLNFDSIGDILVEGSRNQIKIFELNGMAMAIKSFKLPNPFNKVIYKYFRKSKAKRSYEYAKILLQNDIGTAAPIAYFEKFDKRGLLDSYYISEYINADFTFRELIKNTNLPDYEKIIRQFTQFTFKLHEKGIEFLDHSAGNTLIKKVSPNEYKFFLVDLNRMKFHKTLSYNKRLKNLRKLTPDKEMIKAISTEYAKLSGQSAEWTFKKLWTYTRNFNARVQRKRKIKTLSKSLNLF